VLSIYGDVALILLHVVIVMYTKTLHPY